MLNIALLVATNDHIRKFPELHNQAAWAEGIALPPIPDVSIWPENIGKTEDDLRAGNVCGTAFCFAGWAALLAGYHQCIDDPEQVVDETGAVYSMPVAGMVALGLRASVADILFDGGNSPELLDRYVGHLVLHPDADSGALHDIRLDYLLGD